MLFLPSAGKFLMPLANLLVAFLVATAAPAASPTTVVDLSAKVSYLAGGTVYIDAGRSEGLGEGDTLSVQRGSQRISTLRVNYLASHQATCIVLNGTELPVIGDRVVFLARNASGPVVPMVAPAPASPAPVSTSRTQRWLRGRAGVRYLSVRDEGGSHFEQPMLELRADGSGSGPLDFSLDLRGRRTTQSFANGDERQETFTRVYRGSMTWHDPKAQRLLTVGRQSSGAIGPVSLFDGVLAQLGGDRWSAGAFGGTQPDPARMAVSSGVREYGAFAERRQAPLATRRWSVGVGAVSSYDHAAPDRDFAYLQSYYRGNRVSGYLSQEVDFNRAWKRDQGEGAVSFTSTFANARISLTPSWELNTGYDNRRSVRLWRDRETPETQFDDRYRQGTWLGTSWLVATRLRVAGEVRSSGSGLDQADAWSMSADLSRMGWRGLSLRTRYSQYNSDFSDSRLLSFGAGLDPIPSVHLGWIAGERSLQQSISTSESVTRWQEWTMDYTFLRRWYANASYERDQGDSESTSQVYAGLSRRF